LVRRAPQGFETIGFYFTPMLREHRQKLAVVDLHDVMAVVAHEMRFCPDKADGTM
jgi:hypothetical protein